MHLIKLSKFVSNAGALSRRKSDEAILSGRVTINNQVVDKPYLIIETEKDKVLLDGKTISFKKTKYYYALNKPKGYLSDLAVNDERKIARQLIKVNGYLFPVGRLDYHSEGLIIFTNDGHFANLITHPSYEVEREYLVKFKGYLDNNDIDLITKGLMIDNEIYSVLKITHIKNSKSNSWFSIILKEGKNREIRKIGDAINHTILKIKRIRIHTIYLGDLKEGEYRSLHLNEINSILSRRASK